MMLVAALLICLLARDVRADAPGEDDAAFARFLDEHSARVALSAPPAGPGVPAACGVARAWVVADIHDPRLCALLADEWRLGCLFEKNATAACEAAGRRRGSRSSTRVEALTPRLTRSSSTRHRAPSQVVSPPAAVAPSDLVIVLGPHSVAAPALLAQALSRWTGRPRALAGEASVAFGRDASRAPEGPALCADLRACGLRVPGLERLRRREILVLIPNPPPTG